MSGTVTVACKLPVGYNPEFGGVIFAGTNDETAKRSGGYGITEEVDADAYADWAKRRADWVAVKNGLIFAEPTTARAVARAREQAALENGFEPLDPDKAAGITTDTDAMKGGDAAQKALAAKAPG